MSDASILDAIEFDQRIITLNASQYRIWRKLTDLALRSRQWGTVLPPTGLEHSEIVNTLARRLGTQGCHLIRHLERLTKLRLVEMHEDGAIRITLFDEEDDQQREDPRVRRWNERRAADAPAFSRPPVRSFQSEQNQPGDNGYAGLGESETKTFQVSETKTFQVDDTDEFTEADRSENQADNNQISASALRMQRLREKRRAGQNGTSQNGHGHRSEPPKPSHVTPGEPSHVTQIGAEVGPDVTLESVTKPSHVTPEKVNQPSHVTAKSVTGASHPSPSRARLSPDSETLTSPDSENLINSSDSETLNVNVVRPESVTSPTDVTLETVTGDGLVTPETGPAAESPASVDSQMSNSQSSVHSQISNSQMSGLDRDMRRVMVNELLTETGDDKSRGRWMQLWDICRTTDELALWKQALEIFRRRAKTERIANKGAFFNTTLCNLLRDAGIAAPQGSAQERAEISLQARQSMALAAAESQYIASNDAPDSVVSSPGAGP